LKNLIKYAALLCITLTISNSCKKEATPSNCCAEEPFLKNIEDDFFFIPNVFSPNGDAINDKFGVLGGNKKFPDMAPMIKSFIIKQKNGKKLFEKFDFPVNDNASFWDGEDAKENKIFKYEIIIEGKDGKDIVHKGEFCSASMISCKVMRNCAWGSQNTSNYFDSNLPAGEQCY